MEYGVGLVKDLGCAASGSLLLRRTVKRCVSIALKFFWFSLTSSSSRYLGIARKRSLRSERCSVEKSGTKTDAAGEGNANAVCRLPSGEEETEGKLLR